MTRLMNLLKKPIIIFLFLFITLSFSVSADPEQYQTWGVTRDNTYAQDGTGVWTAGAGAKYSTSMRAHSYPLIDDIDNDGTNEIIIMYNNLVRIYEYVTGTGLTIDVSFEIGESVNNGVDNFYQTPGLYDYDDDDFIEIITHNITHAYIYEWNGTHVTQEKNISTGYGVGSGNEYAKYPVWKCAPANQWEGANQDVCVIEFRNRTGSQAEQCIMAYGLDYNETGLACVAQANTDASRHNLHLADLDSDGELEAMFRYYDAANDVIKVYKAEIDSSGTSVELTLLETHDLGASGLFTDIIVNNLDGTLSNGMEITWGYTSDGTNWDAYTIDKTGTVLEDSYCSVLTCPEGEKASVNLVEADDTTYCEFTGDVYYYVRNAANNDPGVNTDTIHCISLYAGSDTQETTVSNVQNFSEEFFIHQVDLYGSTGILTSLFGVQGGTKQAYPIIDTLQYLSPVDYQMSGTLDIIGIDFGADFIYYDDAYTNQNAEITSIYWDTGNPVCLNEIVTFTVGVDDIEGNEGNCFIDEQYGNGTSVATHANTTFNYVPQDLSMNYYADGLGTFILEFNCKDQYHDVFDERIYTIVVSNSTGCNYKGQGGSGTDYESDESAEESDAFEASVDSVFSDIGITSSVGKSMFWIVVMICIGFLLLSHVGSMSGAPYILGFVELLMLVLGWVLGMVGTVVLVIVGLMLALLLAMMFFGKQMNG